MFVATCAPCWFIQHNVIPAFSLSPAASEEIAEKNILANDVPIAISTIIEVSKPMP